MPSKYTIDDEQLNFTYEGIHATNYSSQPWFLLLGLPKSA
jgi:hypothetical protein